MAGAWFTIYDTIVIPLNEADAKNHQLEWTDSRI